MKPCTRIEVVIEHTLARRIVDLLDDIGAPAFTLIERASGQGDRGARRGDDPTGTLSNAVFLIASEDPATTGRIVEGVRPLLARSGGICLVSDAQWLKH